MRCIFPMTKEWLIGIEKLVFRYREAVSCWVFAHSRGLATGFVLHFTKRAFLGVLTCVFALGGAIVGAVTGAIKGQTTETGFCRGAGIGALAGAITAVQLLESMVNGESLSKVALLLSLMNGRAFIEWVIPAVLKAYQWQVSTTETSYGVVSDIYDIAGLKGLSPTSIKKLSQYKFHYGKIIKPHDKISCAICLQDFNNGDSARKLPSCSHFFHLDCIDAWLIRHGSCPMCRTEVCKVTNQPL
ncbi:NEP1-interacting protein 1 [Malania oleifera]|uniref:NEP1-interacting protein 1 n=1 Tax=Malania oleifera TaxID=397392 RepID=UPI0025AE8FCC|nr:NEP1-interacting protein 1 [Malania oleifera]